MWFFASKEGSVGFLRFERGAGGHSGGFGGFVVFFGMMAACYDKKP
jgi:hypothetical protein